jgi:hypothetical protein
MPQRTLSGYGTFKWDKCIAKGGKTMEVLSITLVIASVMVLGYFIGYTVMTADN